MGRKFSDVRVGLRLLALVPLIAASLASPQTVTFLTQWGGQGGGNGQFLRPRGLAVDGNGNVYVADSDNNRIQVFTSSGTYVTQWGTLGSGDGQFETAYGVALDADGKVYVADEDNNRIQVFTSSGTYVTQWGTPGGENGSLALPLGAAVDAGGNVYVADYGHNVIQVFTSSGAYIRQWGGPGSGDGQFGCPEGVAVDASGKVYVADYCNSRIQVFTSTGEYLFQFGNGRVGSPRGVAVDASGNIFVADQGGSPEGGNRILVFTGSGAYLTQWGTVGSGDGQFLYPSGVAVDGNDNVYVAEEGNSRVQVFHFGPPGIPVVTDVIGRGRVSRSPYCLQCPLDIPLMLTAVPLSGARFAGWTGDTTTVQNTLAITVERPLHYVATFERDPAAAPNLTAVSDLPGDQGSLVTVHWQPSPIDTGTVPGVLCCYQIQRQQLSPPGAPWSQIGSVPAASLASYSQNDSTSADSTLSDPAVFRYRVIAQANGDTAQWISNEANGYSVDNLAPPAPTSVSGVIASGFASLSWPAVSASDFAHYAIYRGLEPLPPTDLAHRIGTTTATTFNDSPGYFAHYDVTAIDVHGNESPGTLFVPFNPAGVPGKPAPKVLSVGSPFPSPMARSMSMTLGLPRRMSATVDVLDSQGRLVRRLCEGERPGGWVTLSWDARDAAGHVSAAGMYFVRVQTPEGGSVRRLVLIP